MTSEELTDAIAKLHLAEGDVILVDPAAVDIEALIQMKVPYAHMLVCVDPVPGRTLCDSIETMPKSKLVELLQHLTSA